MMSTHFKQLVEACQLLFGEKTPVSPAFIDYMQPEGLKSAYRTLALENHPDRAAALGVNADTLAGRFQRINEAYEFLMPYVTGEKNAPVEIGPQRQARPQPRPHHRSKRQAPKQKRQQAHRPHADDDHRRDFFYNGKVPGHRLRFGQYLYYKQLISWNTLIAALVWQKSARPRLGSIAIEKGWLADWQARTIQTSIHGQEFWGEAAVRLGVLDESQVRALLGWQRLQGPLIGKYFIESGILSDERLRNHLRQHISHNYRADRAHAQRSQTA
ncbi:MAG: DnaJ domain-containing protein [Planctomycetota bacterium]|jgi:hypothetical protein